VQTPTSTHKAHEEHVRILELLDRMTTRRDRVALLEDVRALVGVLPAHFRAESEPGGLLEAIAARAPNATRKLASLEEEHAILLENLEGLHAELEAEEDGVVEDRLEDAKELARLVREHEERESRLLAELAYEDAGDGD
jgi:hypothetical protein